MFKEIGNKIIFYFLLLAFIVLVSTRWLENILDLLVGAKWSHPIVEFLYINIQGFIILFFISLYSDIAARKELTSIFKNALGKLKEDSTADFSSLINATDLIKLGFKKLFRADEQLFDSMMDLISLNKVCFTDCYVDITLGDAMSGNKDHFCFDLSYAYRANGNNFVLACTNDTSLSETLISRNLADEVICVLSQHLLNEEVLKNISFKAFEGARGGRCIKEYQFKALTEKEAKKHVGDNFGNYDKCKFYRVLYNTSEAQEHKFRFSFKCDLSYKEGYCYWNSPRLMFVKRLTVDLSALSVDVSRFKVQPFLSSSQDMSRINLQTRKYQIEPNDWINRGQGVAIIFPTEVHHEK